MTRKELLACLKQRPCAACKFHTDNGCSTWGCVFEEEPTDLDDILEIIEKYKLRTPPTVYYDLKSDIVNAPALEEEADKENTDADTN